MGVEAGSSSSSGDVISRPYLSRIKSLEGKGVVSVKGGVHHSLVLTSKGEILAFGRGDSGQLGISMVSGEGGLTGERGSWMTSIVENSSTIGYCSISCLPHFFRIKERRILFPLTVLPNIKSFLLLRLKSDFCANQSRNYFMIDILFTCSVY